MRGVCRARVRHGVVGAAIPIWLIAAAALAAPSDQSIEQGRRVYRDGLLPSGAPLQARVAGGATLTGKQAACENCHRRSGLGTSEGGRLVPAIAGETLFRPRQPGQLLVANTLKPAPGARPAYTSTTFARTLRDGVDPAGRTLSELMPRYDLDAETLAALGAYLRTLSVRNPPGVSAQEMHLATILTPNVPAAQRRDLLGVLTAAVDDHNAEIRRETRRGERPVMGHSRAYRAFRKWRLHVWELRGAPETWPAQLEAAMRAQPVFAVVSGVGRGSWQPIHDFCERRELPCLFPNTDRPPSSAGFYSLYLSRGIALEADLVAHEIARAAGHGERTVAQVFRDDDDGRARAHELRQALAPVSGVKLIDRPLPAGVSAAGSSWSTLTTHGVTDGVLWLGEADVAAIGAAARLAPGMPAIYLSSGMLGSPERVPVTLRPVASVIHPFDLPSRWEARRAQLGRWLDGHDLRIGEERVQANAYLAMNLLTRSLKHLREPLSKDYLVERIEHATENSAWLSVYREISLGANAQRFASKGGYVIAWTGEKSAPPEGRWVVPASETPRMPALTRVD